MIAEAATTALPGMMIQARLWLVASMKPPNGVVMAMPATLPIVSAVPIRPLAQPRPSRNTPTNGPIPDCISAIKKFRASRGHKWAGDWRLDFMQPPEFSVEEVFASVGGRLLLNHAG